MVIRLLSIESLIAVSILNFTLWTFIGHYHSYYERQSICNTISNSFNTVAGNRQYSRVESYEPPIELDCDLTVYPTHLLTYYRNNSLGEIDTDYENHSILLGKKLHSYNDSNIKPTDYNISNATANSSTYHRVNNNGSISKEEKDDTENLPQNCNRLIHAQAGLEQDCLAIVYLQSSPSSPQSSAATTSLAYNSLNQIRFNAHWHLMRRLYDSDTNSTGRMETAGFFKVVGHAKGRARMRDKMTPLLTHLAEVEEYVFKKLLERGVLTMSSDVSIDADTDYTALLQQYKQQKKSKRHSNTNPAINTVYTKDDADDVILMVVNEGEMDLLVNFACSCEQHGLDTSKVVVFTSSAHLVPIIESLGHNNKSHSQSQHQHYGLFTAVYHESFAMTSHKASSEYLDDIFVDMMWYKAFSVYIMLRLGGVNVLFQDIDIVWFRDPLPYLRQQVGSSRTSTNRISTNRISTNRTSIVSNDKVNQLNKTTTTTTTTTRESRDATNTATITTVTDAVFTDDGQRALRFAPFFANTGFYYLRASPHSQRLAWSMLTLFDLMQRTGSHQNIMTIRLLEMMELIGSSSSSGSTGSGGSPQQSTLISMPQILQPHLFPNGFTFHHDKVYMDQLRLKQLAQPPYNFHMCWTLNKQEKIANFKSINMWYLPDNTNNNNTNMKTTCQSYIRYYNNYITNNNTYSTQQTADNK